MGVVAAQLPELDEDQGISGYGLALRRLPTLGSVLYITAHPDDEDNALLVKLSRGDGFRVGLLTLTRGDGGQNEIGPELFEALGVLRTEELAAVHRYDAVQQFFSRAFEFGFSYSVEETFEKWGRADTLGDIVRVIREFRPTVILALNPEGEGGGQHHQASARLAAEAFFAAADPNRFPEQLAEGLRPWQPLRLFHARWVGMGSGSGGQIEVQLDRYDPLLGETWAEFGARARGNHRSQGMNILPQPGPYRSRWTLAGNYTDVVPQSDLLEGIQHGLRILASLDPALDSSVTLLESYVDWAMEAFSRGDYPASVKAVMTALATVRQMRQVTSQYEARFLLAEKEKDLLQAARKGHFTYCDAIAVGTSDGVVVPGETLRVRVRYQNRSENPAEMLAVDLRTPPGWLFEPAASGEAGEFKVTVPATASYSGPYWFRSHPGVDRYDVLPGFAGWEENAPPPLSAVVRYRSYGVEAEVVEPVRFRWFDAAYGTERRRELTVVPQFSVAVSPAMAVVRLDSPSPRKFKVAVRNRLAGAADATLRLQAPDGWRLTPSSIQLDFQRENEVQSREFTVSPPTRLAATTVALRAAVERQGQGFDHTVREISYSHIQPRVMREPAEAHIVVMDVKVPPGLRVGYIEGVGDDVAEATEQLGVELVYLSEQDLMAGDLSRFDVIVTGVRAYLARPDLVSNNRRLLEYVARGGHLLVQYNKYEFVDQQFAPYPVDISRPHDRVTAEDSPVRLLEPDHPVFRFPNRIGPEDFTGWVQERGLYFLGGWDSRYRPLLELQDPWPYNPDPKRGALVYTRYGEGSYVYTGLAFFRQLPAGVPGAYRLWANLLSLGKAGAR
jgi:LmbE family N-acetylglucosaminyl deacetylase